MSDTTTATPNVADVEEAMRDVVDPELGINVVDLGLVYGITVDELAAANASNPAYQTFLIGSSLSIPANGSC